MRRIIAIFDRKWAAIVAGYQKRAQRLSFWTMKFSKSGGVLFFGAFLLVNRRLTDVVSNVERYKKLQAEDFLHNFYRVFDTTGAGAEHCAGVYTFQIAATCCLILLSKFV